MSRISDFDKATAKFTDWMECVAGWKQNYAGAAYSTRLRVAIIDAKNAIAAMEMALNMEKPNE